MEFTTKEVNELFKQPRGYRLTHLLGTSYSMNGNVLNELLKQSGIHERELTNLKNSLCILYQRDRYIEGLDDSDNNKVARLAQLQKCIHPVDKNHIKIWIFRFEKKGHNENNNNEIMYRIGVMSRNIASQNMLEGCIILEGIKKDREIEMGAKKDLISFLEDVKKIKEIQNNNEEPLKTMIDDLKCVSFEQSVKKMGDSYKFLWGKNFSKDLENLSANAEKFCSVSPFLSEEVIDKVINKAQKSEVISTLQDISNVDNKLTGGTPEFYYLERQTNSTIQENKNSADQENDNISFHTKEYPLHAKMYAFDYQNNSCVYVGSANFTKNSFQKDDEMMVKITSENKKYAEMLSNSFRNKSPISEEALKEMGKVQRDDYVVNEFTEIEKDDNNKIASLVTEIMRDIERDREREALSILKIKFESNGGPKSPQIENDNGIRNPIKKNDKLLSSLMNALKKEQPDLNKEQYIQWFNDKDFQKGTQSYQLYKRVYDLFVSDLNPSVGNQADIQRK